MFKVFKWERRDEQILVQLLLFLYGNVNGSKVIIWEFQEYCCWGLFSNYIGSSWSFFIIYLYIFIFSEDVVIFFKFWFKWFIFENLVYEKWFDFRMCWYVYLQVLQSFQQEYLFVLCQWSYVILVFLVFKEDSGSVFFMGFSQGIFILLKRKLVGSMCII